MRSAAAVGILGLSLVHCGGIAARPAADDGSSDGGPVGHTGVVGDSGALADAGDEDSPVSCSELESQAVGQFGALAQQYQGCTTDDDCTRIAPQGPGQCVAPCGNVLTNEAGAATLLAAANTACAPFIAAGCKVPVFGCPASDELDICAFGACAGWSAELTWSPTSFVHGACASFVITYHSTQSAPAVAPHDLAFALTAQNGSLYADSTCTTLLTSGSVTLAAGASQVSFGLVPLAAGQSGVSGVGPDNDQLGVSFDAQ
jgi:hypothetical protein